MSTPSDPQARPRYAQLAMSGGHHRYGASDPLRPARCAGGAALPGRAGVCLPARCRPEWWKLRSRRSANWLITSRTPSYTATLNPRNILKSDREPWLTVGPKGLGRRPGLRLQHADQIPVSRPSRGRTPRPVDPPHPRRLRRGRRTRPRATLGTSERGASRARPPPRSPSRQAWSGARSADRLG